MAILNRYKYIIVSVLMIISILSINVIKPKAEIIDSINLINNGNFQDGTTGWSALGTINTNNNILTFITNITGYDTLERSERFFIPNHKYYMSTSFNYKTNLPTNNVVISIGGYRNIYGDINSLNVWTKISGIVTAELGDDNKVFKLYLRTVKDDIVDITDCFVIDLTATFGAGNEPNIIDCNSIYSEYFEGLKRQDIKPHDVTENAHKTVIQMIISTMLVPIDMLKSYKVGNQISLFDIFIGMIILVILTKTILKIGGKTSSDIR